MNVQCWLNGTEINSNDLDSVSERNSILGK
jgi:hypothetical protein